jgi:hypothetical protein
MSCPLPGGGGGERRSESASLRQLGGTARTATATTGASRRKAGQLQHGVASGSGLNSARERWTQLPVPRVLAVHQGADPVGRGGVGFL